MSFLYEVKEYAFQPGQVLPKTRYIGQAIVTTKVMLVFPISAFQRQYLLSSLLNESNDAAHNLSQFYFSAW